MKSIKDNYDGSFIINIFILFKFFFTLPSTRVYVVINLVYLLINMRNPYPFPFTLTVTF